jgi:hypothetical protein
MRAFVYVISGEHGRQKNRIKRQPAPAKGGLSSRRARLPIPN